MANTRRRRLPTTLIAGSLGVLLAVEVTGIALARSTAAAAPVASAPAAITALDARVTLGSTLGSTVGSMSATATAPLAAGFRAATTLATVVPRAIQPAVVREAPKPKAKPAAPKPAAPRTTSFHGRNHVWIPGLGVSRGIQSFPCSRSRPPDAGVYRWGCSGTNNVYLLSHAWSTFKPVHDAYVGGRLHKGLRVWYADGSGKVRQYSVIWWKLTRPTTAASWAWASLSRPSMTLQTCVGAQSQYRLMVRLVQVR
jgi:hypothetical protein